MMLQQNQRNSQNVRKSTVVRRSTKVKSQQHPSQLYEKEENQGPVDVEFSETNKTSEIDVFSAIDESSFDDEAYEQAIAIEYKNIKEDTMLILNCIEYNPMRH